MLSPGSVQSTSSSSQRDSDLMLPSLSSLNLFKQLQQQVDCRLQELQTTIKASLSNKGEGVEGQGNCPVYERCHLVKSSKSRSSYDSLLLPQWVLGFSAIIKEEKIRTQKITR